MGVESSIRKVVYSILKNRFGRRAIRIGSLEFLLPVFSFEVPEVAHFRVKLAFGDFLRESLLRVLGAPSVTWNLILSEA